MKNIRLSMLVLVGAGLFGACTSHNPKVSVGTDIAIADMVQTIPAMNVQKDTLWNIWCGSMIKGYDGKYHLFYSRWPKQTGHNGWISHSQIAYAVAEKPEGPYNYVNNPLPISQVMSWDNAMTHNPYIMKFNDKYYLYYIATTGELVDANSSINNKEWWKRRNKQRIGVAVAENPAGPWKRFGEPVLGENKEDSTAFDAMCVTNPAVCVGRDNKIVMLYKAVSKNGTMVGGPVRFSVAFADSPTGPFQKTNKLIFQPADASQHMVAEDPYIWFDKDKDMYFAIVRDVIGQFTGDDSGALALLQSKDAVDWNLTAKPKVLPRVLTWENGEKYDAKEMHVERPFLYFNENGIPEYLFGAFSEHKNGVFRTHSFNVRIPLVLNTVKKK